MRDVIKFSSTNQIPPKKELKYMIEDAVRNNERDLSESDIETLLHAERNAKIASDIAFVVTFVGLVYQDSFPWVDLAR
ncbi:hypothetical protein HK098_004549 [Nowakowskiella sp. JEL0407]|nr:hypothetical protein HK098_004549 [Nowakowskiella sp. JEL0407]